MKNVSLNRILTIIILVLIVILIFSLKSCQDNKNKILSLNNHISLLDSSYMKSIKVWKDKEGVTHQTIKQLELDKSPLELYTKGIEKKLGIKTKNIGSVTTFNTNTSLDKGLTVQIIIDTVYVDSVHMDTLRQYNFSYQDQWANVKGCVGDSVDCKDSVSIQLTDNYEVTQYKKRHLFKADEYFIDVSNKNPYVQLSSLKSLKLQQTPKKIALGISFGVGYGTQNIFSKSPYPQLLVGISLMYLPISIKF